MGRFISADSLIPSPANPQSLNRYSYVGNNPINGVDPDGHCYPVCTAAIGAGVGAVVGGVAYIGYTAYTEGDFDWSDFGLSVGGGAIGGGLIGTGVGWVAGADAIAATTVAVTAGTTVATGIIEDGDPTNEARMLRELLQKVDIGQGLSAATDISRSVSKLLPSTSDLTRGTTEVRDGIIWVAQYGGHADVQRELLSTGSSIQNIWGYVAQRTSTGLDITNWNSGMINEITHGLRTVPPQIRLQIIEALSRETDWQVIDRVRNIIQ